jgi:hypothetical protein
MDLPIVCDFQFVGLHDLISLHDTARLWKMPERTRGEQTKNEESLGRWMENDGETEVEEEGGNIHMSRGSSLSFSLSVRLDGSGKREQEIGAAFNRFA